MTTEIVRQNGLYPLADQFYRTTKLSPENWKRERNLRARPTGEKRPPKAGEWYLSGALIMAYRAPGGMSADYYIAEIVHTETVMTILGPATLSLLLALTGCSGLPVPAVWSGVFAALCGLGAIGGAIVWMRHDTLRTTRHNRIVFGRSGMKHGRS